MFYYAINHKGFLSPLKLEGKCFMLLVNVRTQLVEYPKFIGTQLVEYLKLIGTQPAYHLYAIDFAADWLVYFKKLLWIPNFNKYEPIFLMILGREYHFSRSSITVFWFVHVLFYLFVLKFWLEKLFYVFYYIGKTPITYRKIFIQSCYWPIEL